MGHLSLRSMRLVACPFGPDVVLSTVQTDVIVNFSVLGVFYTVSVCLEEEATDVLAAAAAASCWPMRGKKAHAAQKVATIRRVL